MSKLLINHLAKLLALSSFLFTLSSKANTLEAKNEQLKKLFEPLISKKALAENPLVFDEGIQLTVSRLIRELNIRRESMSINEFHERVRQKNIEVTIGPHTSGRWITVNDSPVYSLHVAEAGPEGLSLIIIPEDEINTLPTPSTMEADAESTIGFSPTTKDRLRYQEENFLRNGSFEDLKSKNSVRLRHLVSESLITYKNKNNTFGQPTLVILCSEASDKTLGSVENCLDKNQYVYLPKPPKLSKEAALLWVYGTLEKPTMDTFRFGVLNGSVQAVISYLLTLNAHYIDPSVELNYIPMIWSFVFGTTIGTYIDSYVNWVYRGGHLARFAKNYAISLLFSSTLTGLREDWAFLASMGAFASTMSHLVQNAFGNNLLKTEVNNISRQHLISRLFPGKWKGVSIAKLEKEVFYYYPFSVRLFEMLGPKISGVPVGTITMWALIPFTQYMLVLHGEKLIEIADKNPAFRARIDYTALKADVESTRQRWEATKHIRPKFIQDLLTKYKMNQNIDTAGDIFALSQIKALETMKEIESRSQKLPQNLEELLNYFEIQYDSEDDTTYAAKTIPDFILDPKNVHLNQNEKDYLKESWEELRQSVLEALRDFTDANNGLPLSDEIFATNPEIKIKLMERLKLERVMFEVLKEKANGAEHFLPDPNTDEVKAQTLEAHNVLKEGLAKLYQHVQIEETQMTPTSEATAANREFESLLPQWKYLLKHSARNAKVKKPHEKLLSELLQDTKTPSGALPDYLLNFDAIEVETSYRARKESEATQIKKLWDVLYLRVRSKTSSNPSLRQEELVKLLHDEITAYANLVDAMMNFSERWSADHTNAGNSLWALARPKACENFMIWTATTR